MKKHRFLPLLSAFLCVAMLLCAFSACSGEKKYEMKESTKEEKTAILTIGGQDVPYELFRAFFLTRASALDPTLSNEETWEAVMPEVLDDVARVYAVFALCEKYEIDPYSKEIDKALDNRIALSIDGGHINGTYIKGYGTYSAYLDALAESFLTDRASRLLLRYQLAEERLIAKLTEPYKSSYPYTEEDLKAFYESDECRVVEMVYYNTAALPLDEGEALVEKALAMLKNADTDEERIAICMQYFHIKPSNALVSPYAFSLENGGDILKESFKLKIGEYSEPIPVYTALGDYIYLLRRVEKSSGDFKSIAEDVEDLYLRDCFYRELAQKESELQENVSYTSFYHSKVNKTIVFEVKK